MAVIRYTFTGGLRLIGALHIGSGGGGQVGRGDAITDATVIRDSTGRPYIPGSSLRGVLRSAVAQLAPALGLGTLREDGQLEEDVRPLVDVEGEVLSEADIQDRLSANLSAAERLFGTVFWASPLTIPDLHLSAAGDLPGEVRHGVGINRDTGAAQEAIKYDFEVLPSGHSFDLKLRCDVEPTYRDEWLRLLALGLRLLEQGELTLGGRAARGVGQVVLEDLRVYALNMGDRAALIAALIADPPASFGAELAVGWARRTLEEVG